MKIVIDIPQGLKIDFENENWTALTCAEMKNALMHGTPLPKDHGRLVDADALKLTQHDIYVESINYRHRCISVENVDEAPTIIEADKEESEET